MEKTIEMLRKILKYTAPLEPNEKQALTHAIEVLQQVLNIEMPKEKDLDRCPAPEEISNAGYNQALSDSRLFLTKKLEELLEGLEEVIYDELKRQYKGRLPPNLRIKGLAQAIKRNLLGGGG